MNNVTAFVFSWSESEQYRQYIAGQFGVECIIMDKYDHEPVLLNAALAMCQTEFLWFLTPDVHVYNPNTLKSLVEVMEDQEVAVVLPNREADPGVGGSKPYKKYLQDNTAMLYRMSVGSRFDEEFYFTGWNDLDFGLECTHRGFNTFVDPRVAVKKNPTAYGAWSSFRAAYNARNRLLLEAKWCWVGKKDWLSADVFNMNNPHRRIPTIFELAWWDSDTLRRFAASVNMEHPQILMKDGQGTGNEEWRWDGS